MHPKVSVVIPTYNRAPKVPNAIQSVLLQTFSDLEVIVVDDGSSDDTRKILDETFGHRIRYYEQTNQGVSVARNKGLQEAQGEWIAFLDSDDTWEKEKLEWQFKALERFGPACRVCYTDGRFLNTSEVRTIFEVSEGLYRHEGSMDVTKGALELAAKLSQGFCIWPSSLLAHADVVRRTGGFDPKLRCEEDSDFLFRLARLTGFCYVNLPLICLDRAPRESRHQGACADWDTMEFRLQQIQYRLEKRLPLIDGLPETIGKAVRKELSLVHKAWANRYLETGEYGKARKSVSEAVRFDLTFNIVVKWLLTWICPPLALRIMRHRMEIGEKFLPHLG
jgi:glycosyltransferase involved in cell wall biosynthesis